MSATTKGPEFPDLTPIGLAFAQAITYINYQKHTDLDPDARAWLIDAATDLMNQLKNKLQMLHTNKDNRSKLPAWALDPKVPLQLYAHGVPYLLRAYKNQFIDSLLKLCKACGLDVTAQYHHGTDIGYIVFDFTFPEAGLKRKEGEESKEFVFDADFQKKFFGAVKSMKIEDGRGGWR